RELYGEATRGCADISINDLLARAEQIIGRETQGLPAQLKRNGVTTYEGCARFIDPHTLEVQADAPSTRLTAERILVACGTRPAHSPEIPFDDSRLIDTDHLSGLDRVPREMIIVGAGVVGLEYASFMSA